MVLTTSSISPNYNIFFWLSGSKLLSLNYSALSFLLSHLPFHLLQRCCASLVVNPSAEGILPWQPHCPIAGDKVWSGSFELQCCMLLRLLTFSAFAKGKGKLNCFTTETLPLACCCTQALSLSSSCVFYCCQMQVLALVMNSSGLARPPIPTWCLLQKWWCAMKLGGPRRSCYKHASKFLVGKEYSHWPECNPAVPAWGQAGHSDRFNREAIRCSKVTKSGFIQASWSWSGGDG